VRIKSGKHAGKYFTTQGTHLSDPVDASKVPDLVKSIEDALKTKPKKHKSKGVVAVSLRGQPSQPTAEETEQQGDQIIRTTTWTPIDTQQSLSEDCKEGLAQLVSFMAFLETFKPTLYEYTLLSQKLDEVRNCYDQMRDLVAG
jgi:hypothetical protein